MTVDSRVIASRRRIRYVDSMPASWIHVFSFYTLSPSL